MTSPAVDPAKMASLRAQQAYQEKLDAYNNAEEQRLKRKANFGKQTVYGMVAFIVVWAFFNNVVPEAMAGVYIVPFFGAMEFLLILAYLGTLRPNTRPIAPVE
jgi:hypothetical protein